MSWFGGGLSKLQNFTREVLSDVVESVQGEDDPIPEPTEVDEKSSQLQNQLSVLQEQNDGLQVQNRELESQLSTLSRQYRNLLSSLQGNEGEHGTHNSSDTSDGGGGQSATSLQVAETWREVQSWLIQEQIALPAHLDERLKQWINGTAASTAPVQNDESRECCSSLREQIASLEQQLEELDRQHQAALEVALTTRTQYQKENRELQEQLLQLVKERDEAQQSKIGSLFPIDEESEDQVDDRGTKSPVAAINGVGEDLKAENESFRLRIDELSGQLEELTGQLASAEVSRTESEELRNRCEQLQGENSDLLSQWKDQVERLNEENARMAVLLQSADEQKQAWEAKGEEMDRIAAENVNFHQQIEALQSEQQLLAQKSVLVDQLANEKERLKADVDELNRRNEDLLAKAEVIEQLEGENLRLKADLMEIERLADENRQLREQLEQMEASSQTLSENFEKASQLTEENENLRSRLTELLSQTGADGKAESTDERNSGTDNSVLESLEVAELRVEMQRLATQSMELKQLSEDNGSLRRQIDDLTAENAKLVVRCEQLEVQVQEAERCHLVEKSDLTTELEQLKASSSQLEAEIERLRCSMEQSALEHENRLQIAIQELETFKSEQTSSSSEQDVLRNQTEELAIRCRNLEEELTAKSQIIAESQSKLEEEMTRFQSKSQELEAKIQVLEQLQQTLHDEAQKSQNETENFRSEVARLQAEKQELETEFEALKADHLQLKCQHEQLAEEARKEADQLRSECRSMEERIQNATEGDSRLSQLEESRTALMGELETANQEIERLRQSASATDDSRKETETTLTELRSRCQQLEEEGADLTSQCQKLTFDLQQLERDKEQLALTLQAFQQQREQLVQTVQQKHQESVTYHAEAQRLAKICDDLQVRLNEQSELNEEAAKWVSENDALKSVQTRLQAEIDRLRSHLLSVEENHTQELLKGQLREKSLRDALQTAEEKMSDQWRVNDKLAALGDKYRESLAEKERLQQVVDTQEKSLTKLQHVLHQFTREKERDVLAAQKELALKLARAEALQAEKDSEIGHLRRKLSEAQLGLEAAARLTQQLDKTSAALSAAKEEAKSKESDLNRIRQQMEQLQVGTESKVDRLLLKNLLTGYFSAPGGKKAEVLRIIATVLDFTAEERSRVGLDDQGGAASLVAGLTSSIRNISSRSRTSSGSSSIGEADKSLSEAFIRFLETESTRTTPPKLPAQHVMDGSPSASPISAVGMAPFQPGRNEPTILRDVLRDSET